MNKTSFLVVCFCLGGATATRRRGVKYPFVAAMRPEYQTDQYIN
jgi:hypothetical protein